MGSFIKMIFFSALVVGGVFGYLVITDPGAETRANKQKFVEKQEHKPLQGLTDTRTAVISQSSALAQQPRFNAPVQTTNRTQYQRVNKNENPYTYKYQHQGSCKKRITMYSLTDCAACQWQRKQLEKNNILYTELFVDKHRTYLRQLERKAKKAGLENYGFPTLEVNGALLVNPRISEIYNACS